MATKRFIHGDDTDLVVGARTTCGKTIIHAAVTNDSTTFYVRDRHGMALAWKRVDSVRSYYNGKNRPTFFYQG